VLFELDGRFKVGGCSMQGWRRGMEDSHTAILDVFDDGTASFFCVCDGHGGGTCAEEVTNNVHEWLKCCPMFTGPNVAKPENRAYAEGLAWVVGKAEEHLQNLHNQNKLPPCGTTLIGVMVTSTHIYCANVGDSRAVMCRGTKAVDLSRDHKPSSPSEIARVTSVGGTIRNGRLGGLLAMTRALGDFELKNPRKPPQKQALLAVPEVSSCARVLESKPKAGAPPATGPPVLQEAIFLVLACDGIWDCLTSQEVVNFFLEENIADPETDIGTLCESLTRMIVAPRLQPIGSDNMTIMVICLKPNPPTLCQSNSLATSSNLKK
jgi:protein phosphatase PTC2/3